MLLAVLAVAIALAMGHALGHPFLRGNDELETVLENPVVQGPLASAFGGAFRTITVGAWAPLHLLSHALDRAVFGTWAGGSVLVNLLLHLLNATLVAALARRIGAPTLAVWAAGLLFAVHPVQVESVVSITQRKTVLSTAFLLLALHAWVSHARAQETAGRRRFYGLALLAGIAALMTKPVAVVLPLQLALVDLPLGRARASWRSLLEKLPFIVAAAALAVVTALGKVEVSITTAVTGHSRSVGFAGLAWYGGGPVDTFLTMLTVVPRYLRLLFWPVNLSIIYTPPVRTGLDAEVAGSLLLVLALGALLMVAARKRPRLACWAGLFVAGLLPVSQILPQATLMNDRYLYVPLLGGAPLVGEGLALLATRITGGRRALVVALAAGMAMALIFLTRERVTLWASDLALWTDAARKAPDARLAWYNLGHFRESAGDEKGAAEAFVRAAELDALDPFSASHASALLMRRGEFARALPLAERAARLFPTEYDPQYNLGFLRLVQGDVNGARPVLEHAASLDPASCEAATLLGHALALSGEPARATAIYDRIRSTRCDGPDVGLYRAFVAGELHDEHTLTLELDASLSSVRQQLSEFLREPTLSPLLAHGPFVERLESRLRAAKDAPR
ncbi:MAG TPA: tetratricopeptide repeat protein [Myxococcaceae bacterium]|nr:tetratricopeptide repeat protein [Myxococcaceae bacterium]